MLWIPDKSSLLGGTAYKLMVSAFLFGVLSIQATTIVSKHTPKRIGADRHWPFVDYPMYTKSYQDGDAINVKFPLRVILADGTMDTVTEQDLGLGHWDFHILVTRMKNGNEAARQQFLDMYDRAGAARTVQVLTYPLIITRNGPQESESEVIVAYDIPQQRY